MSLPFVIWYSGAMDASFTHDKHATFVGNEKKYDGYRPCIHSYSYGVVRISLMRQGHWVLPTTRNNISKKGTTKKKSWNCGRIKMIYLIFIVMISLNISGVQYVKLFNFI